MTGHKPQTSERHGWRPPGRRSPRSSSGRTARRTRTNPVSYTPTAAIAVAWHFCPPTSLTGLLEPGARKRARPGSEGGPAQQCVGPTRPKGQSHRHCPKGDDPELSLGLSRMARPALAVLICLRRSPIVGRMQDSRSDRERLLLVPTSSYVGLVADFRTERAGVCCLDRTRLTRAVPQSLLLLCRLQGLRWVSMSGVGPHWWHAERRGVGARAIRAAAASGGCRRSLVTTRKRADRWSRRTGN